MSGRLSTFSAAMVIARRDFFAILLSRSFIFFLLGPLFPVVVFMMAGGVGQKVQESVESPVLGVVMSEMESLKFRMAKDSLSEWNGLGLPDLKAVRTLEQGEKVDPAREWAAQSGKVSAIVTGPLENPVLIGPEPVIKAWEGKVSMISAQATGKGPRAFPDVQLSAAAMPKTGDRRSRLMTAQAGQTVLFLLTMLLAGMVLSNLVEEKGNKVIEILAAAIPMDSVFFGKLFAMLAISFVGIGVWALAGLAFMLDPGSPIRALPDPAVGWPLFLALGIVYFAMAYLLIGSVFLAIGSMATTVREVQTLSMPVTMLQLMVFFLASYAMTQPGSPFELFAAIFPFSSPFAMLARAAQDQALLPQGLAILWQSLCVVLFVRVGARLFRTRVLKSGPSGAKGNRKGFFSRLRPSRS